MVTIWYVQEKLVQKMSHYTFTMQLKAVVYNSKMPMNLMLALADRKLSIPYMFNL